MKHQIGELKGRVINLCKLFGVDITMAWKTFCKDVATHVWVVLHCILYFPCVLEGEGGGNFPPPCPPPQMTPMITVQLVRVCCIQGKHLTRGVTLSSDYTVTIGNEYCTPVGDLTSNLLTCRAPAAEPNHTHDDSSFCTDDYAIKVSLRILERCTLTIDV